MAGRKAGPTYGFKIESLSKVRNQSFLLFFLLFQNSFFNPFKT
jgi:hypothetical protein